MWRRFWPGALAVLAALGVTDGAQAVGQDPALWPEEERAFYQDGGGLLLSDEERNELRELSGEERGRWIASFLDQDVLPETPENELPGAIERRRRLAEDAYGSFADVRTQLLFLHGRPAEQRAVECQAVFRPLEIWSYGIADAPAKLIVYEPSPGLPWRLWSPLLGNKRTLYTEEMAYFMEQWEELKKRITGGRRFDRQLCRDESELVDKVTGISGLEPIKSKRQAADHGVYLAAPRDLARWVRSAMKTELPERPPELKVAGLEILFPSWHRGRILTRAQITLPADAGFELATDGDKPEVRLIAEGTVEQSGGQFDHFRARFRFEPPEPGSSIPLILEEPFRPNRIFVLRLKLRDEVGGAEARLVRGFRIPKTPRPIAEQDVPDDVVVAITEELAKKPIPGADSLILMPPDSDVLSGLWRAEALVSGARITKVTFILDGKPQLSRSKPPYDAEIRLSTFPQEQVVRVEGYDAQGNLVASDEMVVNQPKGEFRVRIVEPARGTKAEGRTAVKASVTVPEERRVEKVEFWVDDFLASTDTSPPWEAVVELGQGQAEVSYLSVAAYLDDGTRAEDIRFLTMGPHFDEIDVNLVELYTTVTDRSGRLARGLTQEDFQVFEDGRPQVVTKFELMDDLPLTLCITMDISGSMDQSLGTAKRAAEGFLEKVVGPGDRAFAVVFADEATLVTAPTDDEEAVAQLLSGQRANGWTALHDAIVTSLYYFRGIRGQRALVLLSDGDDTSSSTPFRDALEYARRSGVSIYAVGLDVGAINFEVRNKLGDLTRSTGGRMFFIKKAEELVEVYQEIEEELRSRYLIAYSSDRSDAGDGEFREVQLKVKRSGFKARTIRGYYP